MVIDWLGNFVVELIPSSSDLTQFTWGTGMVLFQRKITMGHATYFSWVGLKRLPRLQHDGLAFELQHNPSWRR